MKYTVTNRVIFFIPHPLVTICFNYIDIIASFYHFKAEVFNTTSYNRTCTINILNSLVLDTLCFSCITNDARNRPKVNSKQEQ